MANAPPHACHGCCVFWQVLAFGSSQSRVGVKSEHERPRKNLNLWTYHVKSSLEVEVTGNL
eukprot:scaffold55881_cov77-Cyclotella_meneghiniana.AAC.7